MDLAVVAGLAIVAGLAAFVARVYRSVRDDPERDLREGPTTRSVDVREGQRRKVVGVLQPLGAPLLAPITSTPCLGFELFLDHCPPYQPGSRTQANSAWSEALSFTDVTRFAVKDAAGSVVVDVTAKSFVLIGEEAPFLSIGADTSHVLAFLSRHVDTRLVRRHDFRYLERRLEAGQEVAVLGLDTGLDATMQPAGTGDYREDSRSVRMTGSPEEPLYICVLRSGDGGEHRS
ncbi:MAG: hypothetical protein AB8I08_18420 [Sandaracinaceae bacterium]